MSVLERLKDVEKDFHEIEIEELELDEYQGSYVQREMKKYLNKGDVFNAIYRLTRNNNIPPYFVCREANVDYNKYKKALYGYDQLSDQEIQRITLWLIDYVGLNLKGKKVKC